MGPDQNRRSFVKAGVTGLAGAAAGMGSAGIAAATPLGAVSASAAAPAAPNPIYRISLAQWAINMSFKQKGGTRDNLEFARIARQNGYDAVEYVNQFFIDKAMDPAYLAEMRRIANGEGVRNVLIMIDQEGRMGNPDKAARDKSVEGHFKWIDAAAALGCHAVRVNAFGGPGSWIEQLGYTGDGFSRVVDHGARNDINVIIENHGGLSSDPYWLIDLMNAVGRERAGLLPDFGNFRRGEGDPPEYVDPYEAVRMLMPYQKGLSVKEFAMHPDGERRRVNFERMMRLALERGFRGFAGVEYGGIERIREAREELEQVRTKLTPLYS